MANYGKLSSKWEYSASQDPKVVVIPDDQPIPDHVLPIIKRLIETRRAWKLSISDVAERCNSEWKMFLRYERGDKIPSTKLLIKWADVLGFELSLWPKGKK